MYKQIFNPNYIDILDLEEKRIFWICIECSFRMEHALYIIKMKHPKLWFKLNTYNIQKQYEFYSFSKKKIGLIGWEHPKIKDNHLFQKLQQDFVEKNRKNQNLIQ